MPKAFEKCVSGGGKVRTITSSSSMVKKMNLQKGQHVKVCYQGKKMHVGERHEKSPLADAIKGRK